MENIQDQVQRLDSEIRAKIEERNKLRLQIEPEIIPDYDLFDRDGNPTRLSSFFNGKDELLLIHNMGKGCVYCTMWADGFRGDARHLNDRMSMVLTSPDSPEIMKDFADSRDWDYPVASYHGTQFAHELGFAEDREGRTFYAPGVSALVKDGDKIMRVSYDSFGPGDLYNTPWHFFEMFPKSVNGWMPKY